MFGRLLSLLLCSASILSSVACRQSTPAEQSHDADVRAIQESETRWNDDFAARNVGRLVEHYAQDAVLMSPGEPASTGPEAIRRSLEQMIADPAFLLSLETAKVEVASSGDLAYTLGSYTLTSTDPRSKQPIHDHGSYVTTYRKQADGVWKAVADIATSSVSGTLATEPNTPAAPKN